MELYKDREWLYNQYINLEQSTPQIAKKLGVGSATINTWIKKIGIKMRSLSEGRQIAMKQGRIKLWKKGDECLFNKGRPAWNKGIKGMHYSPQTEFKGGQDHPGWKGDNATKESIHIWVRKIKPMPNKCEKCGENKKLIISFDHSKGKHTRDPKDYQWLCRKCHINRDIELGIYNFDKYSEILKKQKEGMN